MKHRRSMTMIMSFLLSILTAILPGRQAARAPRDASQLAEPDEKRANEVQPPELVMDILGIRPGLVIGEVGAGHGRVTVQLAARVGDKGKVYANDIDPAAVDYLKARCKRQGLTNAEKAGLKVQTVKTSYEDFDFGRERWDLVAMILSWAPVEEAGFLARLKASIRLGGYAVFEHVIQRSANSFPPGVHALAPGALRELFRDFEILTYREQDHSGDWGGPPTPHVWMVACKRGSRPRA
jgi:SAM-dependent methyltransferase